MKWLLSIALLYHMPLFASLSFTDAPRLTSDAGRTTVDFALNEYADVEVAIINLNDSTVVRRLAAGVLGPSAPAPFMANSLAQHLTWDGTDDAGNRVSTDDRYGVRVRAGMKVELDRMVGNPNPYFFNSIFGAILGDDNDVYVYGSYSGFNWDIMKTVRQFDGEGNYVRTLFPYPAGLSASAFQAWGAHLREDNAPCPAFEDLAAPSFRGMLGERAGAGVIPFTIDGSCLFQQVVSYYPNPSRWELLQLKTGEYSPVRSVLVSNTAELPVVPYAGPGGPQIFSRSGEKDYFYLSGVLSAADSRLNRTGFWLDGTIYRIRYATGTAEPWLTVIPPDSVPELNTTARMTTIGPKQNYNNNDMYYCAAIHGVAFDDSGRVFVCNRLKQRIDVFDAATKTRLGGFAVRFPHMVEVNRRTGALYVLSRSVEAAGSQIAELRKFADWRNPVVTAFYPNIDPDMNYHMPLIRMAVSQKSDKPMIWLTDRTVRILRDDGDSFSVVKVFDNLCTGEKQSLGGFMGTTTAVPTLYERMAVDRKTETLYFTNGWNGLYAIRDWSNPVPEVCRTPDKRLLMAGEVTVSPDRKLWVRGGEGVWSAPVACYELDGGHAPVSLPGRPGNIADSISSRYGYALGDRGLAVSNDGRLAEVSLIDMTRHYYQMKIWDIRNGSSTPLNLGDPLHSGIGGLKFDREGNLYMGVLCRPAGATVPPGFAGDRSYNGVGSVVKLPSTWDTLYTGMGWGGQAPSGALKIYSAEHSPFSSANGGCACRTPRFDLDPYGRLYIPHGLACRVAVTDNNDNPIVSFGEYGNADSYGPGSPLPSPSIPFAAPTTVAASDDYLYVGDMVNARLVRLKMEYALNSMPGIRTSASEVLNSTAAVPVLKASPNPFYSRCRIQGRVPANAGWRLRVFDASGRCIRNLVANHGGSGNLEIDWDARNDAGLVVSTGVYFLRLDFAGHKLITRMLVNR